MVTHSTQLAGTQVITVGTHTIQLVPPRAAAPAGKLLITVLCSLPQSLGWPPKTPQMNISLNKMSFNYTERELGKIRSKVSQPEEFEIRPQRTSFFEDFQKGKRLQVSQMVQVQLCSGASWSSFDLHWHVGGSVLI